jgi:hypothetical protein
MLDQRAERHFMRLLTQKNSNSDLIPDEPDGLVYDEDIPILDSWTERTAEDLWAREIRLSSLSQSTLSSRRGMKRSS